MRPETKKEEVTGDMDFSATDLVVTVDEDARVCVW